MNMQCHRCDGLLTYDSSWSLTEANTCFEYLRCVNCGNHQFVKGISPEGAMQMKKTRVHNRLA